MIEPRDRPPEAGAAIPEPRECFAATLGLTTGCPPAGPWTSASMGMGFHAVLLLGLVLGAMMRPLQPAPPIISPLILQLAPPPPAPVLGGLDSPSERIERTLDRVRTPSHSLRIPDDILSPAFDPFTDEKGGLLDGRLDGMQGGIPGGVLGGVPGGLVGGQLGGTGSELPRFPKPDVGPSPIRMPQPGYTREAIRDNVSGAVVLRAVIDEQGKVQVLKVLRSVPELDEEAIRVVESQWRFQPATRNGRPVPALSDLIVRFQLY